MLRIPSDIPANANHIKVADAFSLHEFECNCCRRVILSPDLLKSLVHFRAYVASPVYVISGYRCPIHNKAVGGHPDSGHMKGKCADVRIINLSTAKIEGAIHQAAFPRIKKYPGDVAFYHLGV